MGNPIVLINGLLIHQVPPLGFWLGDEGSGGHLGKSLVLSYLHKEMPDDMLGFFNKRFGEMTRTDILQKAYKEEFPNRWFATFSKFIFDHRKHPFVYHLIQNSFQEFVSKYFSINLSKTAISLKYISRLIGMERVIMFK